MAGKKTGKRLLTWVLVLVMALSLLPLNALAAGEGGSPHEDVVNGYYDDSGVWNQDVSSAQPDVPGIVSISKTAARAANTNPEDNTYEVTLRVKTEGIKGTNKAATVLVIDTSASMDECMKEEHTHNDNCYAFVGPECKPETNPSHWTHIGNSPIHKLVTCNYDLTTRKYYITNEKKLVCKKEVHSHEDGNCYTRLDAAKKAAIDFLDSYRKGAQSDSGRYVALVAFNKTASNSTAWKDVSSSADYTAAKQWINGLSADGGTNLDAGLSVAGTKFNESPVSSIAAENRNIIVLTDGEPTYCLDSDGNVYGSGLTSLPTVFENTNATAKNIRENVCPIHTICFAADNEKIFDHNTLRFISLSEYLRTYIASDRKAYNASSYDELTDAFSAISDIITSHLTEAVVHDSLPTGVTETGSNLFGSNGKVAWSLFEDFEKEETAGDTTVYTKTYTVTIDPETAGKADGEYCPLNGQTTLTVKSQSTPNGATLPFPIPAGLVTVQNTPEPEPTEPSNENVKNLLDNNAVQIICTNDESNHGSKTFGLIDDTFSIVHNGYNCEVKINSFNEYVYSFNTELDVAQGTHASDASKADQSIINLKWVNGKWTVVDAPAKHYVLCVTPKYTVTYTDGVDNEEVFADQVYGGLLSGAATPAFNGNPARTDYVFAGWKPEVADTVTGNATYVAQWKEDKNHNGIADDEEDKYTVTYTDGVANEEVFADQVYDNLLSGTATPAFNGTPKRDGYQFTGWDSAVPDTMPAENLTFTAKWEKNNIPTYKFDLNDPTIITVNKNFKSKYGRSAERSFTFEATVTIEKEADPIVDVGPNFPYNPSTNNRSTANVEPTYYEATGTVTLKTGKTDVFKFSGKYDLKPGTYHITVKETEGPDRYVVDYDKTTYTYEFIVDSDGKINIDTPITCTFTNKYTKRHTAATPSKPTLNTGDHYAYVMGYPDGTVRPNGSITRAEVSAILFRLLSDKTRDEYFTTESSFTDVKAGAWYNNSIATLEKAGVIVDTAKGGAFRPNEAITRAELAAMLAQFSDAKPVKGVKFSDVSAEHWAYEAIAIAAKMGWIEGYPDGTFRPDATITRAEMMTLVNRALERVPSDEDHLLSKRVMLTFPDCKSGDWFYIAVQEATNSHTYERAVTEKNGDEQWTALRANRDWTQLEK